MELSRVVEADVHNSAQSLVNIRQLISGKEQPMRNLDVIAAVLVIVGALNWGLVGIANFDLVAALFGEGAIISRLIYILVALGGLYELIEVKAIQKRWTGRPTAHPV